MRRDIARRVERLEQRAWISNEPERTIFLCFGDDYSANHAKSGKLEWNRVPDETHTEFKDRIVADLKAARVAPPFAVMLFNFDS
jgi:hypothetical protein